MLRIAKWSETFESAKSRKLVTLTFMSVPTGVDSSGYIELMSRGQDGILAYAVFLAICQWSATCRPGVRGLIARSDGRPLASRQLAMLIRMPVEVVEQSLAILSSEDVGWLEVVNSDSETTSDAVCQSSANHPPTVCHASATDLPTVSLQERKGKEREGKGREEEPAADAAVAGATDPPGEPVPEQSAGSPVVRVPYSEIGAAFDAIFGGRSQLTDKRRKAMQARWRDPWWREHWREALDRAGPSAFLRGGNERGWVIDLEFFLRPDTVAKILEGKYDDRKPTRPGNSAAAREQANADAFAVVYAAAAAARSG